LIVTGVHYLLWNCFDLCRKFKKSNKIADVDEKQASFGGGHELYLNFILTRILE